MLLAIDPGNVSGWAYFTPDGTLFDCGLGETPKLLFGPPEFVVIERPRIYPGGRTKNPNDVLTLAINAGEWGGRYKQLGCPVDYVEPSQWKGQTPKDTQHKRDWARLSAREQDIVAQACKGMAASKRHNCLDAVGIGLFAVKRSR